MRWLFLAAMGLWLTAAGWAQTPDLARRTVDAALSDAADRLRQVVLDQRIEGDVTVADLVRKTDRAALLEETLNRARTIGGPRWLDDGAVEVRLEIPAEQVSRALLQMASTSRWRLPWSVDQLAVHLERWEGRTFAATGSAVAAAAAPAPPGGAWSGIDDETRRSAVDAATRDAVARALDQVRTLAAGDDAALAALLDEPAARSRIAGWIEAQPMTAVAYRDDLNVEVTLVAGTAEFGRMLADLPGARDVDPDAAGALLGRAGPITGAASVSRAEPRPAGIEPLLESPPWRDAQLEATGTVERARSPLHAAREAEALALAALRAQVEALPYGARLRVGDAVQAHPPARRAVERALLRARVFKVEYGPGAAATVRVMLDGRALYQELLVATE